MRLLKEAETVLGQNAPKAAVVIAFAVLESALEGFHKFVAVLELQEQSAPLPADDEPWGSRAGSKIQR